MTALPDDLVVVDATHSRPASAGPTSIVSTGGLGPTPDDLTREAIAAACGETVAVDPDLEAWLRELWRRREMPFPELNLKQAWRIPSCEPLANPNGTAPGWFVTRPDGRVIVALPGPPREMRPMWADEVVPRLRERGLGAEVASRTYRLAGIGESQVAELLGEPLLRATNPIVATYARVEAVDVRDLGRRRRRPIGRGPGRVGRARGPRAVGDYVWATGDDDLGPGDRGAPGGARLDAGDRRDRHGWEPRGPVRRRAVGPLRRIDRARGAGGDGPRPPTTAVADDADEDECLRRTPAVRAPRARELGGAEVGLAVRARPRTGDTAVSIAISTPRGDRRVRRLVFLTGPMGRSRAALTAAAILLETLRGRAGWPTASGVRPRPGPGGR